MAFGNPLLRSTVEKAPTSRQASDAASYNGIAYKLGLSFLALLAGFGYTWYSAFAGNPIGGWMTIGVFGGLILALVISFTSWANGFTVPLYGTCEGLALGGISAVLEVRYPHIVMQSALGTVAAFATVYLLYSARILRATPGFMRFLMVAMGSIFLIYLVDIVAGFFGHHLGFLYGNSPIAILITVGIVIVAALSLVADFAMAEAAVNNAAPVEYEWRIAFGLLVSLVWLYLEILRLLSQLRSRD